MKIGFSSLVCPEWDFSTMVASAADRGFDGVELSLSNDARLSAQSSQALTDPGVARDLLASRGVECVCLGAPFPLTSPLASEVKANQSLIVKAMRAARKLGCPCVRVPMGTRVRLDTRPHALSRVATALRALIPEAVEHGVTLLLENGGDFGDSDALWFVLDSVSHPSLRACWNPCVALGAGERPTISIPRLGRSIGMVHVSDAAFDEQGRLQKYRVPGTGSVEWARAVELLKGVFYDGYLVFHWPKALEPSLAGPETVLPEVSAYLRARIDERQPVLAAYKKDDHAPRYAPAATSKAVSH